MRTVALTPLGRVKPLKVTSEVILYNLFNVTLITLNYLTLQTLIDLGFEDIPSIVLIVKVRSVLEFNPYTCALTPLGLKSGVAPLILKLSFISIS